MLAMNLSMTDELKHRVSRGFLLMLLAAGAWLQSGAAVAQGRALPDFTDLAEQIGPSVVNIRTLDRKSVV